jgi:selenide,water dikinase
MKYVAEKITYMNNLSEYCKALLCDAQTSGGLLIAMKESDAIEYVKEIEELSFGYASIIGNVIPRSITPIIIH